MIRYAIKNSELRDRIETQKPGWLDRARDKTKANEETGEPPPCQTDGELFHRQKSIQRGI